MEDLIKEEEFLVKKEYNPWKRLAFFYFVGLLEAVGIYIFTLGYSEFPEIFDPVMNIYFLSAFIMPFIMIFSSRKIWLLPRLKIVVSLTLLMMVYFFAFVLFHPVFGSQLFSSISEYSSLTYFVLFLFSSVYLIVTLIILYVISLLNRRNTKRLSVS